MTILERRVYSVKPERATDRKVLVLSGADHFVRPRQIPLTLFFEARSDGQEVIPTARLVESLSKVLVHFYPVAGRVRRRCEDGRLEVDCNDEGAEFVEAVVDGSLKELLNDYQPNRAFSELLNPVPAVYGDAVFDFPVCYAQVTRFACGGAALLTTIIHTLTDGLSVTRFITAWSEVCRGVDLSLQPFHDRTLMKAKVLPDPDFHPAELRTLPSTAAITVSSSALPAEHLFVFSPGQVKKLKSMASSLEEGGGFSTFEVINGHVWRSITRARQVDDSKDTKYLTTLDVRTRLKPNLPDGYFGNAICFVSASANVRDIVHMPLSHAAGLIRQTINGFTESYMQSVLAFAENHQGPLAMNVNAGESAGNDVSTASWVRMGFYEMDFGTGKPVFSSPGSNPYDGSVIMMSSHKGKGYINVFIALNSEHMHRLRTDSNFFVET